MDLEIEPSLAPRRNLIPTRLPNPVVNDSSPDDGKILHFEMLPGDTLPCGIGVRKYRHALTKFDLRRWTLAANGAREMHDRPLLGQAEKAADIDWTRPLVAPYLQLRQYRHLQRQGQRFSDDGEPSHVRHHATSIRCLESGCAGVWVCVANRACAVDISLCKYNGFRVPVWICLIDHMNGYEDLQSRMLVSRFAFLHFNSEVVFGC